MGILTRSLGLLAVGGTCALSQYVSAPADLTTKKGYAGVSVRYKEVPAGTCELDPHVKSYSGYADVEENQHIFWWFFEARNENPKDAPLTVWINGGPGSSSMIGLFQENGPCRIDADGNVVNNPYSWSNVSNMLFIDQPVGTGFSYSKPVPAYLDEDSYSIVPLTNTTCPANQTCATWSDPNATTTPNSTAAAAPNFWKTLQGFMGAFPDYSRHGFHFSTESYGGHYGPIFNAYIEEQNKAIAADPSLGHKIKLESVLIGNGWFDPLIQYAAYYNFTVSPGNTYDYFPFNKSISEQMYNAMYGPGQCYDQTVACYTNGTNEQCSSADNFCASNVEELLDNAGRDEYDIRELYDDPFPPAFFVDYLNTPKLQAAIGAFTNFSTSSPTVGNSFGTTGDDDRQDGTIAAVRTLIADNVTVVIYAGDADYNCNWLGGQAVVKEINPPSWDCAGYVNVSTSDGIVHGQVKQSGAFSFVRVYESGHEVPFYQPEIALALLQRALKQKDIATGKKHVYPGSSYLTVGPAESTYREGIATVQFVEYPDTATYNTTTNEPNPVNGTLSKRSGLVGLI